MQKHISIFLLFGLILLFSCKSQQNLPQKQQQLISIIKSTKEQWHSGARAGYSGTDYFITVVINTDNHLAFDSVWTNERVGKLKVLKHDQIIQSNTQITKGDTLMLRSTILETPQDTIKISSPININQNQGLLKLIVNSQTKYSIINSFELLKSPPRP